MKGWDSLISFVPAWSVSVLACAPLAKDSASLNGRLRRLGRKSRRFARRLLPSRKRFQIYKKNYNYRKGQLKTGALPSRPFNIDTVSLSNIGPSSLRALIGPRPNTSMRIPQRMQLKSLKNPFLKNRITISPSYRSVSNERKRTGVLGTIPSSMDRVSSETWIRNHPHGVGTLDGIAYWSRTDGDSCSNESHYHYIEPPGLEDTILAIGQGKHTHEYRPSRTDIYRTYVVLCCMFCSDSIRGPRRRDNRFVPKVRSVIEGSRIDDSGESTSVIREG